MAEIKEVGLVYKPHYKTNCFRVDASACKEFENYIIVCDDKSSYYGVWKWTRAGVTELKPWYNGKRLCYQIPVEKCVKVQDKLFNPYWIKKAADVCKLVKDKEKR